MSSKTQGVADLIAEGRDLGMELAAAVAGSRLVESARAMAPRLGSSAACCCEIPPPCWLPKPLGDVTSNVCPGGKAIVRFRVTNCGIDKRTVEFEAEPKSGVTWSPTKLSLGSMERATASASVEVPAETGSGEERELLLWVRGCNDHYVRWTVRAASRGGDSCHEVEVDDCPDFVHHWYDHFYCNRPCMSRSDRRAA